MHGCKTGTTIERVTPDGGDGCGELNGGEPAISEHAILDGCDRAACSERDGCKTGTILERLSPDGGDGCGDSDGGDPGI